MHNTHKRIAHHHQVQVRRRERPGQLFNGLVGQAEDVRQPLGFLEGFDSFEFAAAAHKAKGNIGPVRQIRCGGQNRVQGMTRAMIAGIHHHELAIQTVGLAKPGPSRLVKPYILIVGPGRDDLDFFGGNTLLQNPIPHEFVEDNDL